MGITRFVIPAIMIFACTCSSMNITKDTCQRDSIVSLSSTGILLRLSDKGIQTQESCAGGMLSWLESTRLKKKVILIPSASTAVSRWIGRNDRLYQESTGGEYQRYKALGVARIFLRNNGAELAKIMEDNALDSLAIYEIDGFYSLEMQFIDSNSVLMIINRNLDILYMDHQKENRDIIESDDQTFRRILLDRQSARLLETLEDLDFLETDN